MFANYVSTLLVILENLNKYYIYSVKFYGEDCSKIKSIICEIESLKGEVEKLDDETDPEQLNYFNCIQNYINDLLLDINYNQIISNNKLGYFVYPPVNLGAVINLDATIGLTWEIVTTSETGYLVQRSLDFETWSTIASLEKNTSSYEDPLDNLNIGELETIYYRVIAKKGGQCSLPSAVASVNVVAGPPINLQAELTGVNDVTLTWTNNTVFPVNYDIQRSTTSSSGFVTIASSDSTQTSYEDTTVLTDTTYYYRICIEGETDCTLEVEITTKFEFIFESNKLPTGAENNAFSPSVTYGGADLPVWSFENGYNFFGISVNDEDGVLTGLDGTIQQVSLFIAEKTQLTSFQADNDGLINTLDVTGLTMLNSIIVNNNLLDSFTLEASSVYDELNFRVNNFSGLLDLSGVDFTNNAIINFNNNNITSYDFSGITGLINQLNLSANSITGTFDGSLIPFTNTAQVLINTNLFTSIIPPVTANNLTFTNNPITGILDLSGLTFHGARAQLNMETLSITSISNYPSMDAGATLGAWRFGGNGSISQDYDDTWVTSYEQFNLKCNSTPLTNLITTRGGDIQIIDIRDVQAPTVDLTSVVWNNSFVAITATGLNVTNSLLLPTFAGKIIAGISISGNFSNTLDFSGGDFFGSRDFNIRVCPNIGGIVLPVAVTANVDNLIFDQNNNAISASYTIQALGATVLTQNNIICDFDSSLPSQAEVDRILTELDNISTGGFSGRDIQVAGTNPAPSAGVIGTVIPSLQSKGFNVTTN